MQPPIINRHLQETYARQKTVYRTEGNTCKTESYGRITQLYRRNTQSYGRETQLYRRETQSYGRETQLYRRKTESNTRKTERNTARADRHRSVHNRISIFFASSFNHVCPEWSQYPVSDSQRYLL